ncbi:MAG TPA: phosphoadenylyl-sulfate reductase [Actinomycetota bacterium]|nr:phosphoadenylyl-sulfate reductase [Actinomycetota bacterium]
MSNKTNIAHDPFAAPALDYATLEHATPRGIVTWAAESIDRLAVATSFQSSGLVILHLLKDIRPGVPVLFLDTGFHFPETLEFKERITELFDLKIVELRGTHGTVEAQNAQYGEELFRTDPDRCCHINKVEPLQRALEEYDGWISGIRRDQSPLRGETPLIEAQMLPSGNEIMKIHPLAHWTKQQVAAYLQEHEIPTHPLLELGFASIGCWPCTRKIDAGEDERAGRWEGLAKTECGIHTFGRSTGPTEAEL